MMNALSLPVSDPYDLPGELVERWFELNPVRYEGRSPKRALKLADRILRYKPAPWRLWLVLHFLTESYILPSQASLIFGHIMASGALSDQEKKQLCLWCLPTPYVWNSVLPEIGIDLEKLAKQQRQELRQQLDQLLKEAKAARKEDHEESGEHDTDVLEESDELLEEGSFEPRVAVYERLRDDMLRSALVWAVHFGSVAPAAAVEFCRKQLKAIEVKRHDFRYLLSFYPRQSYAEGSTDVLLVWRDEFTRAQITRHLGFLLDNSDMRVRAAAYRAGTILLGKQFARPGLEDRARMVRERCAVYVDKGAVDKLPQALQEAFRNKPKEAAAGAWAPKKGDTGVQE